MTHKDINALLASLGLDIPTGGTAGLATSFGGAARKGEKAGMQLLKERAEAFKAQEKDATFPFKMGQFVIPAKGSNYALPLPSIVIDIQPAARAVFTGSQSESSFGNIPNLRVLSLSVDGTLTPIWVEAAQFKLYTPIDER